MSATPGKEVEIKFIVRDIAALATALRAAGFREKTASTFESNTLYDTAAGELRAAGSILRLRVYGERCTLTHKSRGESGRHKSRVEHETQVSNAAEADAILRALGYAPAFVYEKFRAEWSDGQGEVVVDRTPIGDLAEIEGAPEWIDRTARLLGVADADYITSSYGELFFRWKQQNGSAARNMTFAECGTPRPEL
ncbi:MAG: class IV adenylate cyclase [Acidobacteriota bacterium]|nr:class IV adenylate cyclase [Acidobacteriota bacterium]